MSEWLMAGIPRNIAENPDMDVVGRIRDSLRSDNGQTCESSMLAPCPFCGCETPYVQTSSIGDCTEEARVVCPSCHVATTRDGQSWRVSYRGDDVTRTLAIGRAISRWNRRAERTCRMEYNEERSGDELYPTECYNCSECHHMTSDGMPSYCPNCGSKVVDES